MSSHGVALVGDGCAIGEAVNERIEGQNQQQPAGPQQVQQRTRLLSPFSRLLDERRRAKRVLEVRSIQ